MASPLPSYNDTRTLGDLASRIVTEVNRADDVDTTLATTFVQDAIRYWRNRPFFFNQRDNTTVPSWGASTVTYVGGTIQATVAGTAYAFVATTNGTTGTGTPAWSSTIGASVADGTVNWVNAGSVTNAIYSFTALSTVPDVNQYVPPADYIRTVLLQVTVANVRYVLVEKSYEELQSYDVIRPAPPMAYPWWYAFYNQRFYVYPYPNGYWPLTLSYRGADAVPTASSTSNSWTTDAELLIRNFAKGLLYADYLHDELHASESFALAREAEALLREKNVAQTVTGRIPSSEAPWVVN